LENVDLRTNANTGNQARTVEGIGLSHRTTSRGVLRVRCWLHCNRSAQLHHGVSAARSGVGHDDPETETAATDLCAGGAALSSGWRQFFEIFLDGERRDLGTRSVAW
jgi:hypothetical protein